MSAPLSLYAERLKSQQPVRVKWCVLNFAVIIFKVWSPLQSKCFLSLRVHALVDFAQLFPLVPDIRDTLCISLVECRQYVCLWQRTLSLFYPTSLSCFFLFRVLASFGVWGPATLMFMKLDLRPLISVIIRITSLNSCSIFRPCRTCKTSSGQ